LAGPLGVMGGCLAPVGSRSERTWGLSDGNFGSGRSSFVGGMDRIPPQGAPPLAGSPVMGSADKNRWPFYFREHPTASFLDVRHNGRDGWRCWPEGDSLGNGRDNPLGSIRPHDRPAAGRYSYRLNSTASVAGALATALIPVPGRPLYPVSSVFQSGKKARTLILGMIAAVATKSWWVWRAMVSGWRQLGRFSSGRRRGLQQSAIPGPEKNGSNGGSRPQQNLLWENF